MTSRDAAESAISRAKTALEMAAKPDVSARAEDYLVGVAQAHATLAVAHAILATK